MAYDKVVDSVQLETAITATANAIREKTESTDLIEWLASKGFADAIAGIEAGGGVKMVTGSFTLAEDVTGTYYVEHDISSLALDGEAENDTYNKCFAFVSLDNPTELKGAYGFATFKINPLGTNVGVSGGYDGTSMHNNAYVDTIKFILGVGFQLKFGASNAQKGFAGTTYRYFIWRAY